MRAVVTGGAGFLGSHIVALLRARGDDVRVVARQNGTACHTITADVRDAAALERAFQHADVVYHVAGKVGFWGPWEEFWSINVEGTRTVLAAARHCGVPRLVYTSTPSVVGYAGDIENGGQDLPYPSHHENAYAASKCAGERLVLEANGRGIATVALRPHVIIGPGDRRMLPAVVRRAARGQLRIIGDGSNKIDITDVDNAAWAHLDAADALTDDRAPCAGKAYFITNGQPVVLWDWLNELLAALDLPAVTRSLPFPAARLAGLLIEAAWTVFPARGEPPLTRALATVLARSHWYDIAPARRDLGYRVRVSMEEATQRTIRWLAEQLAV
ncbi:MAG TPA: NAD-dependent epimerase/dehydratase family protein [Gemmatimonadales bacterium]|jgi:nucleoside-diphosphate-sugar epimerase|nr:NAD-dependent epimerase/dehydratase family protein [Gemmatimonadales bacterium]